MLFERKIEPGECFNVSNGFHLTLSEMFSTAHTAQYIYYSVTLIQSIVHIVTLQFLCLEPRDEVIIAQISLHSPAPSSALQTDSVLIETAERRGLKI